MKGKTELEEGEHLRLDFNKLAKVASCGQDLIPAVAQDAKSKEVLILGYVNQIALDYALREKVAVFWSTSRNELWVKGATSGDYLDLKDIRINCEQNSLLYLVELRGEGSCHTKDAEGKPRHGCYYRSIVGKDKLAFVAE